MELIYLGPDTYRSVPVPLTLRPNWDRPEASWWRAGVNCALLAVEEK